MIITTSENIKKINKQFSEYWWMQYDEGYKQALSGKSEYSGKTFAGYSGFKAGLKEKSV